MFVFVWFCAFVAVRVAAMLHLLISGHDRRTAPKFGTHVRIDTLTLKQNLTHPTPGWFRGLSIVKKYFATDRAKMWHACADRYSHLNKKLTHPTPGGFRGLSIVKNLSRRTAPKFGTHVRIDNVTLNKNWPTPPQGGLGGYLLLKIFRDELRTDLACMCG